MKKLLIMLLVFCLSFIFHIAKAKHCIIGSPNFQKCVCKHHPKRAGCKGKMHREYLTQATGGVCSIPEGTYVGKALVNATVHGKPVKAKNPLFLVVANNRITGFYAPEDQTHPQGASINQTELNKGPTFFLTSTSMGDLLNFKYEGIELPIGKAKLIKIKEGSDTFVGYYLPRIDNGSTGDFINVGKDGGFVARATSGMNFNFFFGKIDLNARFVQAFPFKGNGPRLDFGFSPGEITLIVNSFENSVVFEKEDSSTCFSGDVGGLISNLALIEAFKENLDELKAAVESFDKATNLDEILRGDTATTHVGTVTLYIDSIKNTFGSDSTPKECKRHAFESLKRIREQILIFKKAICKKGNKKEPDQCIEPEIFESNFSKIKDLYKRVISGFRLDDDDNEIPDVCDEQQVGRL